MHNLSFSLFSLSFFASVLNEADTIADAFIDKVGVSQFSLEQVREMAQSQIGDPKVVMELAMIGALRGNRPKGGDQIYLSNGDNLDQCIAKNDFYTGGGNPGGKLSLVRLSQAFAEPVVITLQKAYKLGKLKKRFPTNKLPPYLEFMGAGSLQMPPEIRQEHRMFAVEFSEVLARAKGERGKMATMLYDNMERNAEPTRKFQFRGVRLEPISRDVNTWEHLASKLHVDLI